MKVKDIEEVNKLLKQREKVQDQLSDLSSEEEMVSVEIWFNAQYSHFAPEYHHSDLIQQLRENILLAIEQHLQDIENTLTLTYSIELED